QRGGQLRLRQSVACGPVSAAFLEDTLRFRVLREVASALEGFRQRVTYGNPAACKLRRGGNEIGPFAAAVFPMRQLESAHGAGDTGRFPTIQALAGGFAGSIQIHVARGFLWGALAEVDESRASVGEADQHEAAASQVAGVRMGHGEGESDG